MRLEDRALQVLLASFAGPRLSEEWGALLADGLGGVCLFGSNLTGRSHDLADLTRTIREAGSAALIAVDEEGGDVTRLHVATGSPVLGAAALGAVDDTGLTLAVGAAVAADLASVGIDLDLGPVADVNSNPGNPVIGTRSFGADPALVARHVAAWVEGLHSGGVAACVKHFPGHGDTAQDSHLTLPTLEVTESVLRDRELVPFAAAVDAGVGAVMTSHLTVPALDGGRPATLSPVILDVLRNDLGFDGVVVSDALDMAGASRGRGIPEAAVLALGAGCDLLCLGPDQSAAQVREVRDAIGAAVLAGRIAEERLVEAADRVGRLRRRTPAGAPPVPSEALTPRLARAARQAIRVEGTLPDLTGARVVSIDTEATIAVGPGRWGLAPDLVLPPGAGLPAGPLVVQVRDAGRRPDVTATLARLDRSSVVVEWGWPGDPVRRATGDEVPRICTWGHSAPGVAAVEEIVRELGWR